MEPNLRERMRLAAGVILGKRSPVGADIIAWLRGQDTTGRGIGRPYKDHPWVKAAISIISRAFARPSLQLWRGDELLEDHELLTLLKAPGGNMSGRKLREGTCVHLEQSGNAAWVLETGQDAPTPTAPIVGISLPHPSRVTAGRIEGGRVATWILDKNKPNRRTLAWWEVIHFSYFNPWDDIVGLAAISAIKKSMNLDDATTDRLLSLMRGGSNVGMYLDAGDKVMKPEQARKIQREWAEKQGSPSREGRIPVMHSGLSLQNVGQNNREMQLQQLAEGNIRTFSAGMLVPPILLGDWNRATYNNAPVQERVLWEWNVIPKHEDWIERLNAELVPRFGADLELTVDYSMIQALQRTLAEELDAATKVAALGVPLRQIEEMFDLGIPVDDIPWADTHFVPSSMIPAELAMEGAGLAGPAFAPTDGNGGTPPADRSAPPRPRLVPALDGKRLPGPERLALWAKRVEPQLAHERKMMRALSQHFAKLRAEVLRNLRRSWRRLVADNPSRPGKAVGDVSPATLARSVFAFDLEQAAKDGETRLLPVYGDALDDAAKAATVEIGAEAVIGLGGEVPADVLAVLHWVPNRIKGFDAVAWDRISRVIEDGIQVGLSEKKMALRIKQEFNISAFQHAPTIARTETALAFNHAHFRVMGAAGVRRHEWLTAGDERVRDSHVAQDGQVVAVGEEFDNGLLHPLDVFGDASETINCRCITLAVFEGEETAGAEDLAS